MKTSTFVDNNFDVTLEDYENEFQSYIAIETSKYINNNSIDILILTNDELTEIIEIVKESLQPNFYN